MEIGYQNEKARHELFPLQLDSVLVKNIPLTSGLLSKDSNNMRYLTTV